MRYHHRSPDLNPRVRQSEAYKERKILLLASDDKIRDRVILDQIERHRAS